MLRDHEHDYFLGPGYQVNDDGSTTEQYWHRVESSDLVVPAVPEDGSGSPSTQRNKQPYKVELVGVTCSPTLAVARGFWRRLRTGRGVPIAAQLRSHKAFAGMPSGRDRERRLTMVAAAKVSISVAS